MIHKMVQNKTNNSPICEKSACCMYVWNVGKLPPSFLYVYHLGFITTMFDLHNYRSVAILSYIYNR